MRLKEIRRHNGLSQADIAEVLGVTRSTVCQWEQGKRTPDAETLVKLADLLLVTVDYLLERTEKHENLSTIEEDLLALFRCFPPDYHNHIIDLFLNELNKIKLGDIIQTLAQLDSDQVEKVAEYAEFIAHSKQQ